MAIDVIRLEEKLSSFDELWSPRIIAQLNDYHFKLAKARGDFIWHSHPDTDEVFVVLEGQLRIQLRDGPINLSAGEMCVVPRGVEHKPSADDECHILLVEPMATVNTGDAGGERTAEDAWT